MQGRKTENIFTMPTGQARDVSGWPPVGHRVWVGLAIDWIALFLEAHKFRMYPNHLCFIRYNIKT
jgi:hypothetical protein